MAEQVIKRHKSPAAIVEAAKRTKCTITPMDAKITKRAMLETAASIPSHATIVKEEKQDDDARGGVEEAEAPGSAAATDEPHIDLRMKKAMLVCQICHLPLKPPIFKCKDGLFVCCHCGLNLCGAQHCSELDTFFSAIEVPCSYRKYGCKMFVTYHDAAKHEEVCAFAPCYCSEPGCGFVGSPPMLLDHLIAVHSWLVEDIEYANVLELRLPALAQRRLLFAKEDHRLFLLSVGVLGEAVLTAAVVCVRGNGETAGPWYKHTMWVHAAVDPASGIEGSLILHDKVVSSIVPCAVSAQLRTLLPVPPAMLLGDDGPKEICLRVRIDRHASPCSPA